MTGRIGTRAALTVGLFSVMLGFVAGSFATEYWHLYLTIGVLYGVGSGTLYFSAITVLAQYFHKRRGVVVGIAISGSGIGATVMAPLLRWMLVQIGFRWSMRIMGGTMFVCLGIASCFVRPYHRPTVLHFPNPTLVPSPSYQSFVIDLASAAPELSLNADATTTLQDPSPPALDFRLFKSMSFSLVFLATNLFALVYLVPLLLAPSFATSIGLSAAEGATMISIASAVGIAARIIIGHLADRYGVLNATFVCCTITGLACLTLWLNAASFVTMAAFMVLYGCFAGSSIMLFPVAATKAVNDPPPTASNSSSTGGQSRNVAHSSYRAGGDNDVSSALGFIFFAHTIGYLFGTPLAQFLIENQGGRYAGAIVFVGVSNFVCAFIVFLARVKGSKKISARI
ncbi:hypothetical protein EMPS_07429 [Entomortierella parvispora]|uniref:Major facilitator superfamily (MFS) profile domain-containing protein n=1 Tax=Entomortierella parvispora TaxID=205924 RepID=A0A9P3LY53_9FUNG|nr:hypothetical protein EMPS_07429 [Entomortierella parvispora]